MLRSKVFIPVIYLIGWLLFFGLIIGFVSTTSARVTGTSFGIYTNYLLFFIFYMFIFYLNERYLVPKLALQKKYLSYFLIIGLILVAVVLLQPFQILLFHENRAGIEMTPPEESFHRPPPPPSVQTFPPPDKPPLHREPSSSARRPTVDIISIVLFFMIWSSSSALQIIRQWRTTEQRAARAEADKANAELSFLKAQINPHFLFNTLNNIYALAVTNNENTAISIMKLSNIMRYLTDEVSEDYVPLESELECISNYIDLQKLRLSKKARVDFSINGIIEGKKIASLVLMTFVENVFKYGISNHEPSSIIIKVEVHQNMINFFCQNTLFTTTKKIERTGIGIANTKQRLEYLYPKKHTLKINTENHLYTVQLSLQL